MVTVHCSGIAESAPDRSEVERRLVVAFRKLPSPARDALLRDVEIRSFNFGRQSSGPDLGGCNG